MAAQEQILTILAGASGPMSRADLEKEMGESYRGFQTPLDRLAAPKKKLIEDVGDHHYVLTEKGREAILRKGDFKDIEDEIDKEPAFTREQHVGKDEQTEVEKEPGLAGSEPTQESLATTPYQQFLRLGKVTGVVPLTLIKQTADYIWEGGDYADMKWVAQALKDMDIRPDLRGRWWNSWRVKMHKAIPIDLPAEFFPEGKKGGEKEEGSRKRDYILEEDDSPAYVGEGLGDLEYTDAVALSKMRTARRKDSAQPASAGSMADEVTKIFHAFKEVMGGRVEGKSYVVRPAQDGFQVEEVEPNKPLLIPSPQPPRSGPSYLVDNDGVVKELNPGQPVVIMREAPKQVSASSHYLIDRNTGEMKEVAPGQPVIIIKESAPASQLTPIQMTDRDGKPMVLDLTTYIKLDDHREQQRREEESHKTKMEIAQTFKDLLGKATTALGHIGEGK